MQHRIRLVASLALSALCGGAACASTKLAYTPSELKKEVARRVPGVSADEVVAPFAIDEAATAAARAAIAAEVSDVDRTRALVTAFFASRGYHLRYAWAVTTGIEETLRKSEGNCLSLAAVFVGLARAAGLQAFFIDASTRVHETRQGNGWTVNAGHVTAMVLADSGRIGLDFGELGPITWYQVLDDVEALAHFYNNRGFEMLDESREHGETAWRQAAKDFRLAARTLATRTRPSRSIAWPLERIPIWRRRATTSACSISRRPGSPRRSKPWARPRVSSRRVGTSSTTWPSPGCARAIARERRTLCGKRSGCAAIIPKRRRRSTVSAIIRRGRGERR